MDTMNDLLPCPFCGGKAERRECDQKGDDFGGSYIGCSHCNASTALEFGRKENLVERWNHRCTAERDTLKALCVELADAYDLVIHVMFGTTIPAKQADLLTRARSILK